MDNLTPIITTLKNNITVRNQNEQNELFEIHSFDKTLVFAAFDSETVIIAFPFENPIGMAIAWESGTMVEFLQEKEIFDQPLIDKNVTDRLCSLLVETPLLLNHISIIIELLILIEKENAYLMGITHGYKKARGIQK